MNFLTITNILRKYTWLKSSNMVALKYLQNRPLHLDDLKEEPVMEVKIRILGALETMH